MVKITIPQSTEIITNALFNELLLQQKIKREQVTEIAIPDSVTEIAEGAFHGCERITSIIIPDGVTRIGAVTFCLCLNLTMIIIPESVMIIGAHAFGRALGYLQSPYLKESWRLARTHSNTAIASARL